MANEKQAAANGTKAVQKYDNISEQVLARIEDFQKTGGMVLPKDYSVENHMKSAWLILQATTDRSGQQALAVCTKESIANALLDMVLQGLAVSKKQGYFIVYGNKLEFQRSYFGTVALAKRTGVSRRNPLLMSFMRAMSSSTQSTRKRLVSQSLSTNRRSRISTTTKSRAHMLWSRLQMALRR